MTRTKRCYNTKAILAGPGLSGIVVSQKLKDYPVDGTLQHKGWVGYHPYAQFCMGHCKYCRDPQNNYRNKRKKNRYIEIMLEKLGFVRDIGDWVYREDDGT